jgi:hypothetical protein
MDAFSRYLPSQCVNVSETQQNRAFLADFNVSEPIAADTSKNAKNPYGMGITDTLTHQQRISGGEGNAPDPDGWSFHLDDQSSATATGGAA